MHGAAMSTLAEIEKAIAALPATEQRELYRHLGSRIGDAPAHAQPRTLKRATKTREWARHARGSVRLASGETVDDARMAHYSAKYGIKA